MHALRTRKNVRGGFIHVPWLPEQIKNRKGQPSMPIEVMIKAIEIVVKVSLKKTKDKRVAAGAEH
jgi:pyroglutamyl-peptidase